MRSAFLYLWLLALSLISISANAEKAGSLCHQNYADNNYVAALVSCQRESNRGSGEAAYLIAALHAGGLGVPKRADASIPWLNLEAERGHIEALYNLGVAYQYGKGVGQDILRAMNWYGMAAEQNSAKAMRNLARLYEEGAEDESHLEQAQHWYHRCAQAGHPECQMKWGIALLDGSGVESNQQRALYWLRKAGGGGENNAQLMLGVLLEELSPAESLRWYLLSAKQGNIFAMHNLGVLYFEGTSVEQDYDRALEWLNHAIDGGHSKSTQLRQQILALKQATRTSTDVHSERTGDGTAWLLNNHGDDYTIQLAAIVGQGNMARFITQHQLQNRSYSHQRGNQWLLLYGVYKSYQQAEQSLEQLSGALKKNGPWIQQFASLQKKYFDSSTQ